MPDRPRAIAFDVIETLFPLDPLRPRLERAGLGRDALEPVFASILRDAFALDTCGIFKPFAEVAAGVLGHLGVDAGDRDEILAGFAELAPHPDVAAALQRVVAEGLPICALTNGNAETTRTLFERAGLGAQVDRIISIDEIGRWKPAAEVYRHAADAMRVEPGALALVACHGWDLQGAKRAGLVTGYVRRSGPISSAMAPADATSDTLPGVIDALLG